MIIVVCNGDGAGGGCDAGQVCTNPGQSNALCGMYIIKLYNFGYVFNQWIIMEVLFIFTMRSFISLILENPTCDVTDETFDSTAAACKCGTAETCKDKTTGEFCDAANNICKCSSTEDACANGQVCNAGQCGEYNIRIQ